MCRLSILSLAISVVLGAGSSAVSVAWDLKGSVRYESSDGRSLAVAAELPNTLIVFHSDAAPRTQAQHSTTDVVMVRKQFTPRVTAVEVGGQVRFPNQDPILHNAFSLSPGNEFDLGLYRGSDGETVDMTEPGLVRVYCNVHQDMVAYVWVLDSSFWTRPTADGRFELEGLPEGSGELTVWHERAEPVVKRLSAPPAEVFDVVLTLSKQRVPRHANKFGKRYTNRQERGY